MVLQHSGKTGLSYELKVQPRFVRGSFSHLVRRPGQEVKLHGLFEGVPDGTKVELQFLATTLEGLVEAKGIPGPEKVSGGRVTFKWKVDFEGEVGDGFFAMVQAMFSAPDDPNLAGMAQNALAATRFGAIVDHIDKQFCPGVETMTTKYTVVDPYDYVRGGIFRVYGNNVDGKSFPDKKALVYQRLLTPAELTPGSHKVEWEGFANRSKGAFAPPEKGGIAYADPMYAPYVVQVQLLDRVCDDAEKWPDKDALPSLPSPLYFKGLGLKKGDAGYEPVTAPDKPTHSGFEIVYAGVELTLGDYVTHPDEALKNSKRLYQYLLNQRGYFCGPVDGSIGALSKLGLMHFRRTHWEVVQDDTKPTNRKPDTKKPLGGQYFSKVTGKLDAATQEAILEEQTPRDVLQIVDDNLAATGEVNRLPAADEKARILLDADIPTKDYDEWNNGNTSQNKQKREAKTFARPWLPVLARPLLLKKDGSKGTWQESRYGAGQPRILFRALEPKEDRSALGFRNTAWTAQDGQYVEHVVPAGGQTLQQICTAHQDRGFKYRKSSSDPWTYFVNEIWNDPANAAVKAANPGAVNTLNLAAGTRVQIPPFPHYLKYKKHKGRYTEGANTIDTMPQGYVDTKLTAVAGEAPTAEGYDGVAFDNAPADIKGKTNFGIRDPKEKLRGIEALRYGRKVYPLEPFEPGEEKDERLGKGKVVAVPVMQAKGRRGEAGLFFVPSLIAGDSYRLEAELDLKRLTAKKEHPNAKALEKRYPQASIDLVKGRTGLMTVWRRYHVAAFLFIKDRTLGINDNPPSPGLPAIQQIDWAQVAAKYKKAFCELLPPLAPTGRAVTNEEHREIRKLVDPSIPNATLATITVDPEEFYPPDEMSTQSGTESIDDFWERVHNESGRWKDEYMVEAEKVIRPKLDVENPAQRQRNRGGWIILDIRRYFLPQTFIDNCNPTPSVAVQNNIRRLLEDGSVYSSICGDNGWLLMDQRDRGPAHTLFAHEMGHGIYLRHYLYAGDQNPTHHDSGDLFCDMSYGGPGEKALVDQDFCGLCLLRLRGWSEAAIAKI